MGRLRKAIATSILAASLALGTVSGLGIEQSWNRINQDPDYITSMKIDEVTGKANEGLSYLYNAKERGRIPNTVEARKEINQAINYLHPIQRQVDPQGRIKRELQEVERSLPREHVEKEDIHLQQNKLYDSVSQLSKAKLSYQEKAYDKHLAEFARGMLGLTTSIAGGTGALVEIINEQKKRKKSLEDKSKNVAVLIAGLGIFISFITFSSKMTGYSIINLPNNINNGMGIVFFIIGIISLLFYFSKKTLNSTFLTN